MKRFFKVMISDRANWLNFGGLLGSQWCLGWGNGSMLAVCCWFYCSCVQCFGILWIFTRGSRLNRKRRAWAQRLKEIQTQIDFWGKECDRLREDCGGMLVASLMVPVHGPEVREAIERYQVAVHRLRGEINILEEHSKNYPKAAP